VQVAAVGQVSPGFLETAQSATDLSALDRGVGGGEERLAGEGGVSQKLPACAAAAIGRCGTDP